VDLGTPLRVIRALPTRDGRANYRNAFHLKRWDFAKRLYGDRGVPGRILGKIPIVLNPRDNVVSRPIFLSGAFEEAELNFISGTLKPGMVAADIGANIGVHTLVMATAVGASGSVHAFEPSAAFAWLRRNIRRNSFEQVVIGNEMAIGSQTGTIKLNKCTEGNEAFTSSSEPLFGSCHETFESRAITLDEYAQSNHVLKFDLVKIDVEGHELQVFEGCEKLFARRAIRCIMFEVNNTCLKRAGTTSSRLVTLLRERNFALHILDNGGALKTCPGEPGGDWTTIIASQAPIVSAFSSHI